LALLGPLIRPKRIPGANPLNQRRAAVKVPEVPPPNLLPASTEYDSAKQELVGLISWRHVLQDKLAVAVAVNSVLVERLGSEPRSTAYEENRKLRILKHDLMDSFYSRSEDILIFQNFSENSAARLGEVFESNRAARRQRSLRIAESARGQAVAKLSEIERFKAEIPGLVERQAQLKKELESSWDDRSLEDCKVGLMDVHAKSVRLQQELHESVLAELQLRFENEVIRLRRDAAARISRIRASQEEVRTKFRALQDEWNLAQKNEEEFAGTEELGRLDTLFGELAAEIETVAGEEARDEGHVMKREMEEIHGVGIGVKKWAADLHTMALAARARCLALENQGQKNEEMKQRDVATAALDGLLKRLGELDSMLGGRSGNVSLEERFQSIHERVVVVLAEQETLSGLSVKERTLRERPNRLRRK
jgi:hypothetical protein